ncbi:MAG TPA: choice-of-anchor tandem repeat GloVer-containing protein [Terriglobia bacterium]|nr:choice-of-anchor tandem repeat GloVer-containing protein [Terriglobia bacterium]
MTLAAAIGSALAVTAVPTSVPARGTSRAISLLYSFQCGADGSHPYGGLVEDASSNLFGTTYYGGTSGKGTVFEVTTTGVESVLYSFTGGADGGYPAAGLVLDSNGNFFGTAVGGGTGGQGVVFKVTTAGVESVLYNFTGGADGGYPEAGLVEDSAGNLYGTTFNGGSNGQGTVFEVTPAGVETVLYSFAGPTADGSGPAAGLARDTAGNLYGTTLNGGVFGDGVVFKLTSGGVETILHSFTGAPGDGSGPAAGVILDSAGNLFGTTNAGGAMGNGVVFKITPAGVESLLFSFDGHLGGRDPSSGMVEDSLGNLYGTTEFGGNVMCQFSLCGLIFELSPTGKETVLHNLAGSPSDGANPYSGSSLFRDSTGNLYGTTFKGGESNCGTVYKLLP